MKPLHYLKFVPFIALPIGSHLSSSLLQLYLPFSTYAFPYFTEVTRALHAQSTTSPNANRPLHVLQGSQHDKTIATFL